MRKPEDPVKQAARRRTKYAVQCGRLSRPALCERCGGKRGRIEAHHPDYSRPLDVQWLCQECHVVVHRELLGPQPEPLGRMNVGTYLDPESYDKLAEIAKEEDRSLSAIVKRALLREIALHEEVKAA